MNFQAFQLYVLEYPQYCKMWYHWDNCYIGIFEDVEQVTKKNVKEWLLNV